MNEQKNIGSPDDGDSDVRELSQALNHKLAQVPSALTQLRNQLLNPDGQRPLQPAESSEESCIELGRKMVSGQPAPKPVSPPSFSQVLQSIVEPQRTGWPANISLTLDIQPDLRPILCGAADLARLTGNVFQNAIEAMPFGGRIVVTAYNLELVAPYQVNVPQTALLPGKFVRLSVSDTGCGIAPKNLGRVFAKGFSTKAGQNQGLGLATVAKIVAEQHGGIRVESFVGEGSRFDLYLPSLD